MHAKKHKNSKSKTSMVTQLERAEKLSLIRLQPIQWESAPILHGVARFTSTGGTNFVVLSIRDLLILPGVVMTTTTVAIPTCLAVRLKRMRIWGPVTTQGTSVSVSIQKAGIDSTSNDFNDPFRKVQDSSLSFDRPAFVQLNFDKFTPSGSWHTNVNINGNIATVYCPAGAIIDFDYAYVQNMNNAVSATTFSGLTANTVGTQGRIRVLGAGCTPNGVIDLT